MNNRTVRQLVVHCSATKPSADIGVTEIDRWHRQRGFNKVGYHFVIKRDGTIQEGRKLDEVGAHVKGHNSQSVGVCVVGGVSQEDHTVAENNFTAEQVASLRTLLEQLRVIYPGAEVLGHRDFPGVAKECPSFDVKAWWSKQHNGGPSMDEAN